MRLPFCSLLVLAVASAGRGTSETSSLSVLSLGDVAEGDNPAPQPQRAFVRSISPQRGPYSGGTEVLIRGGQLMNTSSLLCVFGEVATPITRWLNESTVVCVTPKQREPGFTKACMMYETDDLHDLLLHPESCVDFTFDAPVQLYSFFPVSGPASGNFTVMITGGTFFPGVGLVCRFYDQWVTATYIDAGTLVCVAPPTPPGWYPLEVSLNGQDFTTQRKMLHFYEDEQLSRIHPVTGPASSAGTLVHVFGHGFVNSSSLVCRFGDVVVPAAAFVSTNEILCRTPRWRRSLKLLVLPDQANRHPDPLHGSKVLFPTAHIYPMVTGMLVKVEVSNNRQDFTNSGVTYLYHADPTVEAVQPQTLFVRSGSAHFVRGTNVMNTTALVCRFGETVVPATFLSSELLLCFAPKPVATVRDRPMYHTAYREMLDKMASPVVEISNNGVDFTADAHHLQQNVRCPPGTYCPISDTTAILPCPEGTYCPGYDNFNFTLCPRGTYQPRAGQTDCYRCPIGFFCPEAGMPVPRICPAGYVCEVTGIEIADQPCPEGHYCLEGTATTATTCGHPIPQPGLFPTLPHTRRRHTIMRGDTEGSRPRLGMGARNAACWDNSTSDFGLQLSDLPARVWMEKHLLPFSTDSHFYPLRGRYCLDDACIRLADMGSMQVADYAFNYSASSYMLRRPVPCPSGVYCHPGTAVSTIEIGNFSTPQPCAESMYCPEGSSTPSGVGHCPPGFYCPFGRRITCPPGTYCPRDGHVDPMVCPPGTFNAMQGQLHCTLCPRGFVCPGFGRIYPDLCPAGLVCSRVGLSIANQRCPAGFYCPNGTLTADPLRNDTTLRPYPCSPGTYCLSGTGYSEPKKGNFLYAQPCTSGFYCEVASPTATGNGLCPRGFVCAEGTAVPVPTQRGFYARLEGTITAAACLPGYYSPTIESSTCVPCPPGTSCEEEGTYLAEVCGPGTYRSTLSNDGQSCVACPQGRWSKNWGLREIGECTKCPPGTVCPVESLTTPCSLSDLPTPYEPVVSVDGIPVPEYFYPEYAMPKSFTSVECLKMNEGYTEGTMNPMDQVYFFGELIPPYIDVLGRGAHFRSANQNGVKYQAKAKCYRNFQPFGSRVYQRYANYFGPQYDIQTGSRHQGYGTDDYEGFFGVGSGYIDLAHARRFEPGFNCTFGFQLMNESLASPTQETIVYTDPAHDYIGGYQQRPILWGADQWYPGTCEADIICDSESSTEAQVCPDGYICDETTDSTESTTSLCHEGYVCAAGTTPDLSLQAALGQFKRLCPAGYMCTDGTGEGQAFRTICPENYFCPSGTGDVYTGGMADDATNRGLDASQSNPFLSKQHVLYAADDVVQLLSEHDRRCMDGVEPDLVNRYTTVWVSSNASLVNPQLIFLREVRPDAPVPYTNDSGMTGYADGQFYRPIVRSLAVGENEQCARDHKWRLVENAVWREDCDCVAYFHAVIAVYRLWKCHSDGTLEDLGLGSVQDNLAGGRDSWFHRAPRSAQQCIFGPTDNGLNLTHGHVPLADDGHTIIGPHNHGLLDVTNHLELRVTWSDVVNFTSYNELKQRVEPIYSAQYDAVFTGSSEAIDPFVYDLRQAIRAVEEFGEMLEQLVWLDDDMKPGRLDMCECQRLLRCPNGTSSVPGADDVNDCISTGDEVLRRINTIPSWFTNNDAFIKNATDFTELGGRDDFPIGTLSLEALQVATITVDFSGLDRNFTYGQHYRISAYVDCKPCPPQYSCDVNAKDFSCTSPSLEEQQTLYDNCLETYKLESCISSDGKQVACDNENVAVRFKEPDWFKCRQIPFFCQDQDYHRMTWQVLVNQAGQPLPAAEQERSTYAEHPSEDETFFQTTPGCCRCQRRELPEFFEDETADMGYPDNKHNYVQLSFLALRDIELTVVVELLHGLYYGVFDKQVKDTGDLSLFSPSRALYTPKKVQKAQFMAVLEEAEMTNAVALPLNLPLHISTSGGGTATVTTSMENDVLIGRVSDIELGDREYNVRKKTRQLEAYLNQPVEVRQNTSLEYDVDDLKHVSEALYGVQQDFDVVAQQSVWWELGDTQPMEFIALPYLPFFSNCEGYGNYISIAKLLEDHLECDFVPFKFTRPVDQYLTSGDFIPEADKCYLRSSTPSRLSDLQIQYSEPYRGAEVLCMYDEQVELGSATPRWYEMPAGSTLFSVTKEPIRASQFVGSYRMNNVGELEYTERWGRGSTIESIRGTYRLIPVEVMDGMGGYENAIPRHVTLLVEYYQVEKGYKRMVGMTVSFSEICHTVISGPESQKRNFAKQGIPPCEINANNKVASYQYMLELQLIPLDWFELLNRFEFEIFVYVIFFTMVGVVTIALGLVVWIINRLLTKLRNPPPFHSWLLLSTASQPALIGLVLGVIPFLSGIGWLIMWLRSPATGGLMGSSDPVNNPSSLNFEDVAGDWQDNAVLDEERVEKYRMGRTGACMVIGGFLVMLQSAQLLVPELDANGDSSNKLGPQHENVLGADEDDDANLASHDNVFKPTLWKRMHLIWCSLLIVAFMLFVWEFSYSNMFEDNVYMYLFLYKAATTILESILENVLREKLLLSALLVATKVTEAMITMGADDFSDFTLSFFVETAISMIERLYIENSIKNMMRQWPKWKMQLRRKYRRKKRMTREEKAKEELEWRTINEEIALEAEGIEPLLDSYQGYTVEVLGILLFPIVNVVLLLYYTETQIPMAYAIRENEFVYYTFFAGYIVPFLLCFDMILFNIWELVYGWKVFDYVSYQRYRFSVRDHRWMMRNTIFDESIDQSMQSLDALCFSSQYYFIQSLFAMAILSVAMGITVLLRTNYIIFADPVLPVLIVVMVILVELLIIIFKKLADVKVLRFGWRGLWVTKQIEGTVDDEVAAKLAIGEGRQQDLEQERLELQALNSERFRHRFLERNKPWILQHLVELLTPRSLESLGADGRPVVEYIRDVHADLMAMGEGVRRRGDRDDISSDDEDELESARRAWPRVPLLGASLAIAKLWLMKARKRRAFTKLVRGIIDSNMQDRCGACGRDILQTNIKLAVSLASNGQPDPFAIDRIIAMFEEQYGMNEADPQLWRAFFRAHAQFVTRCSLCDAKAAGSVPQTARSVDLTSTPARVTRPEDFSSSDDEEDRIFEPMIVVRSSVEGRIMSKWLVAARKKLGGTFPRPEARRQMERYAQRMRDMKTRRGGRSSRRRDHFATGVVAAAAHDQDHDLAHKDWPTQFSAVTTAIGQRWLKAARENTQKRFQERTEKLQEELRECLRKMKEEDDWYFGSETRMEGHQLAETISELLNDRTAKDAETSLKIRKINADMEVFCQEREQEIKRMTEDFEKKLMQSTNKATAELEQRLIEFAQARETKKRQLDEEQLQAKQEQGAAPTHMVQHHQQLLAAMDEQMKEEQARMEAARAEFERHQRSYFERTRQHLILEIEQRRATAAENVARIRAEAFAAMRAAEADWQHQAVRWLAAAKRKVAVREKELEEAKRKR